MALTPLRAWDVLHDLIYMLATPRPCCLAAHSTRECSAHVVFPFTFDRFFELSIPLGVFQERRNLNETVFVGRVADERRYSALSAQRLVVPPCLVVEIPANHGVTGVPGVPGGPTGACSRVAALS